WCKTDEWSTVTTTVGPEALGRQLRGIARDGAVAAVTVLRDASRHRSEPCGCCSWCKTGGCGAMIPTTGPQALRRRLGEIMRDEYGDIFDGMTSTAVELYKHMINDVKS
ncbi:unnamed protein product, partial [Sphacelaria rigidula]